MRQQPSTYLLAVILMLGFTISQGSCGTLGGNPGGDGEKKQTGKVSFSLTDAAVEDAKNVFVTIATVEVLSDDDSWVEIPLEEESEVDLLTLQNGDTLKLAKLDTLPVGTYSQTRLVLSEEKASRLVDLDGTEHELKVPSGSESGLKIKSSFTVKADESVDLTLDFDLRKSIHSSGHGSHLKYIMKPVLRLVNDKDAGVIAGTSTNGITVCVYAKDAVKDATDDCETSENSGKVAGGKFKVHFLPEGDYDLRVFYEDGTYTDKDGITVSADKTTDVGDIQ